MQRILNMLLVVTLAAVMPAEAQEVVSVGLVTFVGPGSSSNASVEHVVARLMSFDDNRDGRVEQAELIDRMQPLLARGDSNGDGALDDPEIRAAAAAALTTPVRTGPFGRTYVMPPANGFLDRSRLEGLLDDLKLPDDTQRRALEVVEAVWTDGIERGALATLLRDMESLLTREQLARFEHLARTRRVARVATVTTAAGRTPLEQPRQRAGFTLRGPNLASALGQFRLTPAQNHQAHAAIARYQASLKGLGAEARGALVEQLSRILTPEDLESFRASLDRRNAVPTPVFTHDVVGGVIGGVVGGLRPARPAIPPPGTSPIAQPSLAGQEP